MSQILSDGPRNVVVSVDGPFTLNRANLSGAPQRLTLEKLWYDTGTATDVVVSWEATVNALAWKCTGTHALDFTEFGGIVNDAGAGVTGNVVFAGTGVFSVVAQFKKT